MKKSLHIIASAAVVMAALTSCAKEQFKENAIPAGEKIQVSISGRIGELTPADATKATAGSVVRVTWENGDKVFVYDGTSAPIGTLAVTPDDNNASYALLSGTITASSASPAPTKLTLVCVKGVTEAPAIAEGRISIDLSTQNEEEVPFVLYSTIEYDAQKLVKANEYMPFSFATSLMTVGCTGLSTGAENVGIDITKAEIDGVSTACELTIDGSGVTAVSGNSTGTITRTAGFEQSDSRGSFKLALAADPATPAARNILVHQGSKVSGSPFTSPTLAAGKSYNTVYQMCEYVAPPAGVLPGEFTVNSEGKKVHFSQGNLYAKKTGDNWNWSFYDEQYKFLAANMEVSGSYYSPQRRVSDNETEIDLFTWGYSTFTSLDPTGWLYVTAHTTDGNKLVYDKASSEGGDDWGVAYCESNEIAVGTWRTLSTAEWQYLFKTDTPNRMVNGKPCYSNAMSGVTIGGATYKGIFLYPDDYSGKEVVDNTETWTWDKINSAGIVFLPAAGYRGGGSEVDLVGGYGFYWSSTASAENGAYLVRFVSDNVTPGNYSYRSSGSSVRLITESAGGYAPAVKVTSVTLGKTETSIGEGSSETLSAIVTPANATNKQVAWSSSDEAVATVDENGEVTGIAAGSAVITATTADGHFTAVCLVTVKTLPVGALKGEFSVSDTKKVHFSQGNLTYNVSTTNWAFYEHQYDCATGYDANLISLFTWGYDAVKSIVPDGTEYVTAHTQDGDKLIYDKASSNGGDDWGVAYCESNKITVGTWRTLSNDEWLYLFNTRTMTNGKDRYSKALGNGVTIEGATYKGVFLYPDNYNGEVVSSSMTWDAINAAGIVCLPAAGFRSNSSDVSDVGNYGICWSSAASEVGRAYFVLFDSDEAPDSGTGDRYYGYSVRLITESN